MFVALPHPRAPQACIDDPILDALDAPKADHTDAHLCVSHST